MPAALNAAAPAGPTQTPDLTYAAGLAAGAAQPAVANSRARPVHCRPGDRPAFPHRSSRARRSPGSVASAPISPRRRPCRDRRSARRARPPGRGWSTPISGWRRRSSRCRPRCEAVGCSHKVSAFQSATTRPGRPAMAVSGSPPRSETPSMSLFTSRRLLPSGMSRAIKALDKKSATPSHVHVGDSKFQSCAAQMLT